MMKLKVQDLTVWSVCLSGRLYGADDFLPMLTYVLAQCDMPQLDNEILYMMELLDPSLLHGEGLFGSNLRASTLNTPQKKNILLLTVYVNIVNPVPVCVQAATT